MLKGIEKKLGAMNTSLNSVVAHLDKLSAEQLHKKPEGNWSAAQVLNHLYDSERGTLAYLKKKFQAPEHEVKKAGLASFIRSVFLRRALRNYNRKFKAPAVLQALPDNPDYAKLKNDYYLLRRDMASTLEHIDNKKAGKAYFKHPLAGRLNIYQTMDFLSDHFERHAAQIRERTKI